jgi:hypothetical protein
MRASGFRQTDWSVRIGEKIHIRTSIMIHEVRFEEKFTRNDKRVRKRPIADREVLLCRHGGNSFRVSRGHDAENHSQQTIKHSVTRAGAVGSKRWKKNTLNRIFCNKEQRGSPDWINARKGTTDGIILPLKYLYGSSTKTQREPQIHTSLWTLKRRFRHSFWPHIVGRDFICRRRTNADRQKIYSWKTKSDSKSKYHGLYPDHTGYRYKWTRHENQTNTVGRIWKHIHYERLEES